LHLIPLNNNESISVSLSGALENGELFSFNLKTAMDERWGIFGLDDCLGSNFDTYLYFKDNELPNFFPQILIELPLFIRQILEICDVLHKYGVAHRDFKPENFLARLIEGKNRFEIKIADLGFASSFSDPVEILQYNCGTREFAAPEVHLEKDTINKWESTSLSDCFSIGKMLKQIIDEFFPIAGKKFIPIIEGLLQPNPKARLNFSQALSILDKIEQSSKLGLSKQQQSFCDNVFSIRVKQGSKDDLLGQLQEFLGKIIQAINGNDGQKYSKFFGFIQFQCEQYPKDLFYAIDINFISYKLNAMNHFIIPVSDIRKVLQDSSFKFVENFSTIETLSQILSSQYNVNPEHFQIYQFSTYQ